MPKIIVAVPCQKINRFLLPPHSKHVMSHTFSGGGIVLARVLNRLVTGGETSEEAKTMWEKALEKWKKGSLAGGKSNPGLPDRFIRFAPFAAVPALKKQLRPDTKFLRADEKEDGDGFYRDVQAAFGFEDELIGRDVYIVGGEFPEKMWSTARKPVMVPKKRDSVTIGKKDDDTDKSAGSETPAAPNGGPVIYILAKSIESLRKHISSARESNKGPLEIIGQIDVESVSETYPIQTDTSYERTVGDICRGILPGLDSQPKTEGDDGPPNLLQSLLKDGELDHLVIRIGNAACLLASPGDKYETALKAPKDTEKFLLNLVCHPDRCASTTFPGLGSMLAYDILLCAAIVRKISAKIGAVPLGGGSEENKRKQGYEALLSGAKEGVQATYRSFLEGFGIFESENDEAKRVMMKREPDEFFAKFIEHGMFAESLSKEEREGKASSLLYSSQETSESLRTVLEKLPKPTLCFQVHYQTAHSPNKLWRMVVPDAHGSGERESLKAALGHLKNPNELPIVRIGALHLVDRQEVEDYLYLQRLLLTYQADVEWRRPLCIGVFGQPGAGKSFGVKQLVSEMSENSGAFSKDGIEVNLSQLRSLDELADCFHLVRDACLQSSLPLVFFDEFDSTFENRSFGWLKYFLAPMQDGKFFSKGKTYSFGKAIFVFAGGVNHSFAEFNERTRNPDFCDAKGPDFISRLRGILNITSMNRPEIETHEYIYMIRRAVVLQYLLERHLGKGAKSLIEDSLASAFLTIPRFKHGARSLEAILDMSTFERGLPFHHGNLPPRDQLDMHVDAREFLRLAGVLTPLSKG